MLPAQKNMTQERSIGGEFCSFFSGLYKLPLFRGRRAPVSASPAGVSAIPDVVAATPAAGSKVDNKEAIRRKNSIAAALVFVAGAIQFGPELVSVLKGGAASPIPDTRNVPGKNLPQGHSAAPTTSALVSANGEMQWCAGPTFLQAPEMPRALTDAETAFKGDKIVNVDTPTEKGFAISHTVQAGETLTALARRYGLRGKVDDLAWANGMPNPNLIHPGDNLIIPLGLVTPKAGDSFEATVARRLGSDAKKDNYAPDLGALLQMLNRSKDCVSSPLLVPEFKKGAYSRYGHLRRKA